MSLDGLANPEVSVVLPVWNGSRFLSAAIESVLQQTCRSLELVLIDDGSTDGSLEIAHSFARRDPRVRFFARPHEGLVRALNFGLSQSSSRYVARMDADDVCFATRLTTQIAWLESHPACVAVGSWIEVIDQESRHVGFRAFAERHDEIVKALLLGGNPMIHPSAMIRRDALIQVQGYADRYPSEDYDLWLRLSRVGQLANMPEVLLQHRRHEGSVSFRERSWQLNVAEEVVDAARRSRGLAPLARSIGDFSRDSRSWYHANCAATALVGGPRIAALRHAVAGVALDPFHRQAWSLLFACSIPGVVLRLLAAVRYQKLGLLFPGALYASSAGSSSSAGSANTGIRK